MEKSVSVAVLLTVHNRKNETLRCLSCLYSQESQLIYSLSVFMTDDGCTDGTIEAVRDKFHDVRIVKGDGSLFWNRGMLKAWEAASTEKSYDYYIWLNDDTIIKPQTMFCLLEAAILKNNKAIIVGATYSMDGKYTTYGGRTKSGTIPLESDTLTKVSYFNGNIVLIPSAVFDKIGMLDSYFSHSKGDFDYGMRASKAGFEIFQVGKYLGYCDLHSRIDKWCDPNIPFKKRWKMLHLPNGMPPHETFYLNRRHYGILSAVFHFCTVYIRCFLPSLWNRRNRKYLQRK